MFHKYLCNASQQNIIVVIIVIIIIIIIIMLSSSLLLLLLLLLTIMIDIIMKATISTHASRHLLRASIVVYTMLNEIFSPYTYA